MNDKKYWEQLEKKYRNLKCYKKMLKDTNKSEEKTYHVDYKNKTTNEYNFLQICVSAKSLLEALNKANDRVKKIKKRGWDLEPIGAKEV